ncbi:MAG: DEAD/DEAH box helicase [Bacteroides sp.]|nr:DEAD/DEAH box helicase [Bacteroides sp.]
MNAQPASNIDYNNSRNLASLIENHLKVTPYDYQKDGILFGLQKKRFLIGDEPGLGKTLQSIGVVDCAAAYPCLVICPSSLKINWQREFEKFADVKALVLDNSTQSTFPYLLKMGIYQVAIVNFESLRKYFVWDIKARRGQPFRLKDVVFSDCIKLFRSVIIDESHRVKDPSAQQTIFTKGICSGKKYIALLSGTPVVNRPQDLIAQLSIMDRLGENFGSRSQFIADYCSFGKDQEEEQAQALASLSVKLYANCMIRREKKSVLKELPDKTRTDLLVELDSESREIYNTAAADLRQYLEKYTGCTDVEIRRKMRMEALVKFMTLRSLSAKGKIKQAVDFVNNFLANDKPLILFCSLHEIVDAIKKAFPQAVTITGRETSLEKQAAVDSFQSGNARLALCSIKAAGVGLTLTASSNVAFVEFPWTYADCCQCEDRAHRIGQKDNVTCYYLLGRNTIDRTLYNIIHSKKTIANQIMAANDDIPQDEMYFDELVSNFTRGWTDGDN